MQATPPVFKAREKTLLVDSGDARAMPTSDTVFDAVITSPLTLRRQAILQLAGAQYPAGRHELAQAVDAHLEAPEHSWDGLWVAMHGDTLKAALWVQALPGNMAQLWRPHARAALG
ncbi:MAG: hypothetical protein L0I84_02570 [Halomonas subglaciescola]|nr:hypothetical protein [Halomonas subglaciescola]